MNINKRIKELRLFLKLSQKDFATKIGLKPTSLCDIEHCRCKVNEQNIILICSIFNVNELWIKNGEGKMFKNSNQSFNELLTIYEKLDAPYQNFILKVCYELRNTQDNIKK